MLHSFFYRSGRWNGLNLRLFEGLYNEPRSEAYNLTFADGLMVFIHNKSSMITTNNINILPGVASYLGLRKTIDTDLSLPYNDCINDLKSYKPFDSRLYKELTNYGYGLIYNQQLCLDLAFQRLELNCTLPNFEDCVFMNMNISRLVNNFSNYYEFQTFKKYLPMCPEECTTTEFQITLSQNSYPSKNEYDYLKRNSKLMSKFSNASLNDLKQSVYMVSIYFEDLKYTLISQQAKTNLMDLVRVLVVHLAYFLALHFLV